jgi:hypothetical protein
MNDWTRDLLVGALLAVALTACDLVATGLRFGELLGAGGQVTVFIVLVLGILGTISVPLALGLGIAGRHLRQRRRTVHVASGAVVSGLTLVLNFQLGTAHPVFLAILVLGGGLYGGGLAWLSYRLPLRRWLLLGPAAMACLLFVLDASQLRGLYERQHVTVGLYVWLAAYTVISGILTHFGPTRRSGRLLVLGGITPVLLATLVFWSAPGDAVSEDLRYAVLNGSTAARNGLWVLAPLTDLDGDGYPVLLGRGDCEPFDGSAHPGAREIVGDGIDQNCLAGDPTREAATTYRGWAERRLETSLAPVQNVILLTIDAARADRSMGPRALPALAQLTHQGITFENAYALFPGTIPSLYGMAVSDYPSAIEFTPYRNFEFPSKDTRTTLFETLGGAGIKQFGAVYHKVLSPRFGITRGLPEVWAPSSSAEGISARETTAQGLAFLDQTSATTRFFLWLHYFDPHAPYELAEGEVGEDDQTRYDAEVIRAAGALTQFLDEVARRGLLETTAIIIAADHGEEFGDHGATHHGQALYDESIKVPLVVRFPGGGSRTVSTPVSLLDLAPTIVSLLGLPAGAPADWKGRSLVPYLVGQDVVDPFPVYLEAFGKGGERQVYGVVAKGHKLIYRPAQELFELYDLTADPVEGRNLTGRPQVAPLEAELRGLLDLHLAVDLN